MTAPPADPSAAASPAPSQGQWTRVIAAGICALVLTVGLARFGYTPMLPVMREDAGLSALAGGWLATINYAGYMAGALIASSISDLHRKHQLYRLGLIIAVVTTAAMGLTQNVVLWAILRFAGGVSSTAGLLLASGLILNWLIRHGRRPELGLHFAGIGLGVVVSGVAVAATLGALPWDGQWLALGALGVVLLVPAWLWMPSPGKAHAQAALKAPAPPGRAWMGLLVGAYFCAGFGYVISATFIVAIVESLPLLAGKGNMVWVVIGLAAIPSCFLWDRVAGAFGMTRALILAYVLQILSILLPALSGDTVANLLSGALYGVTFVGIVSLTLSLIGRCFPLNPAKAMARLTLSYGVAQIVAPALAGMMATLSGGYRGSLVVAAGVMAAGVVLLMLMGRQERREAREPACQAS